MEKKNRKVYIIWIAVCEAVGLLAGTLTRQAAEIYNLVAVKPLFSPPGWVFPMVWTALYALMGVGAAQITLSPFSTERSRGLNLMVTQLVVNFFWPLLFFNAQAYGFAFLWLLLLWLLVLWMIVEFYKTHPAAAYLQIPYLLWLTFAAYLNAAVWILNYG